MAEQRYNLKNAGVKRILQEVKEFQSNPADDYMSMPLEDNIFEWQFAIRGPKDSEFEGGIYHGRIQLPPEYPFKPPAFMLLTPNGRFETQTKICLSISAHHPEHWQPSWSVRTALVALIAFMPTKPEGALGSLDYTKEERRILAIKSREAAPKFGNVERQQLIDEIHSQMLIKAHPVPVPEEPEPSSGESQVVDERQEETSAAADVAVATTPQATAEEAPAATTAPAIASATTAAAAAAAGGAATTAATAARATATRHEHHHQRQQHSNDYGLTVLAFGLTVAIIGLLVKKVLKLYGYVDL